jgi:phosphatidylserine/phosphatidylglycerophosphate/cardiolipin synthase-like enzyme
MLAQGAAMKTAWHRWGLVALLTTAAGWTTACSGAAEDASAADDALARSKKDGGAKDAGAADAGAPAPAILESFATPSAAGQQPVVDAIDGATTSLHMMMFHLTVAPVVDALVAAKKRGVDVRLIFDAGNWASHTPSSVKKPLAAAGISVTPSSSGFSITHTKSLAIDGKKLLVMSLNLTSPYPTTRDYAVETDDAAALADFEAVFAADVENAASGGKTTPTLTSNALLWSPVNSESRLVSFIEGAEHTLVATAENLGDSKVQAALLAAVERGVSVRLIAPECDQNPNPLYDMPFLAKLAAGGVQARAMPAPASAQQPYMHAKMMIADGARAYIGSMNFSTNSLTLAREVGIMLSDPATIATFAPLFEEDWKVAIAPPAASTVSCPTADAVIEP